MTPTPPAAGRFRSAHPARAPGSDYEATLTERHAVLMALVTLLVVLAVGIAAGSGIAWLLLTAWHHAGLPTAVGNP